MNISKTVEALEGNGYTVSVFPSSKKAAEYLNDQIHDTSVGFGGSMTLQEMGLYDSLSEHNQVCWHWKPQSGETAPRVLVVAQTTQVYLTSANGVSENGEIVNIDGTGNRLASTLFGHEKVYFIIGTNKVMPDLEQTINRVRNVAAPLNAKRLARKTPCAVKGDKCYDCNSPDRICNGMVVHFRKMGSCPMEVVIVEESLGF